MIDLASKYEEELKQKFRDTWYDDKYKYYHSSNWHSDLEIAKDGDWNEMQFVSIIKDETEYCIVGYIGVSVDRARNCVTNLSIINFTDKKVTFGKDVAQIFEDLFCKFGFRKIEFSVVRGNPIEDTYDRMVKRYGGRIVGVLKEHFLLIDNKFYDKKIYEIFKEDFINKK